MSSAPDLDVRERVRAANEIVEVIGSSLGELRRQGANYVVRCPWHNDTKPSLSINPARQSWKCWPCDIGGDVFSFVMRRDGVSFPEALKILADRAGITIERTGKPVQKGSPEDKTTLLEAMRWAEGQFYDYLDKSTGANIVRDYLQQRGISEESRKGFRIGFAPDEWDWLIGAGLDAGFSPQILAACCLASAKRSGNGFVDFFRGRLMFPIFDLQNRPIAFGGRHVPGVGDQSGGKYLNSSETKLFSKRHQLYALNQARHEIQKSQRVLVMEGYTDVVAANQFGINTAVACLGVAVGETHIQLLKRFAEEIVLVLDGDQAGQKRADSLTELFVASDVNMRVLTLPDGNDPAEYLEQHGAEAFNNLIKKAPDAIEHKLARETEGVDFRNNTHASSAALDSMLRLVAKAPQQSNSLRTEQILMRLSRTFGLPTDNLRNRLTQHRRSAQARPSFQSEPARLPQRPPEPLKGIDRELFELMVEDGGLVPQALESVHPNLLSGNTASALMNLYEELEFEGKDLDFQSVLLATEDPHLKSTLVGIQSTVDEKAEHIAVPPAERLSKVIEKYRMIQENQTRQQQLNDLEQTASDEEELELLKQIIEQERSRQGLRGQRGEE